MLVQPEILADEANQHVLAVGESPAVIEKPQDEQYDQNKEGRCQSADDDKCDVCHFIFLCKGSGKNRKAFPTA